MFHDVGSVQTLVNTTRRFVEGMNLDGYHQFTSQFFVPFTSIYHTYQPYQLYHRQILRRSSVQEAAKSRNQPQEANNVGIFHNIPYTSWMQQLATARRNNNSWSSLVWWVCTLVTLKRPWDVWDLWSTVSTQSTRLTFNSLWSPSRGTREKSRKLTKVFVKCWKALSKAVMGSNRP